MLGNSGFAIEILQVDALTVAADLLIGKDAFGAGGLDGKLRRMLKNETAQQESDYYRLYQLRRGDISSPWVMVIKTVSIYALGYEEIRRLGYQMLAGLQETGIEVQHAVTTAHGINTGLGLDEVEALRSLLLGFADAVEAGKVPASLQKISIAEFTPHRYELFREALQQFFPPEAELLPTAPPVAAPPASPDDGPVRSPSAPAMPEAVEEALGGAAADVGVLLQGVDSFEAHYRKPLADEDTPHVFVAMPFAEDYDDQYYLAIRPVVTAQDLLCIRLDQPDAAFTGDIMEQVKARIRSAKLVIALLDGRNPNVYLEVGYAWGVGTPTLLILHEDEEAPFDVRGARLLAYRQMYRLKEQLAQEVRALLGRP